MRHVQWEPPLLGLLWCLKPCQPVLCSSWGLLAPWKLLRKTWNSTWNTLKIVSFSEVIFGDRHSCWTKRIMSVVSDPCLDWKKIFKWFQIQTFTIYIYIHDYMYAYIWFLSFFNKRMFEKVRACRTWPDRIHLMVPDFFDETLTNGGAALLLQKQGVDFVAKTFQEAPRYANLIAAFVSQLGRRLLPDTQKNIKKRSPTQP